jgi:hypothetical protein
MRQAQPHVLLILRGPVTGERRRIVGKFNNHIARSRRALDAFEFAGADQIAPAEFPEDRLIADRIGLVAPSLFTSTRPIQ